MAIANHFYNETTRKYVALFGTIFNQLKIQRKDNNGTAIQSMIVPLSYAPFQKVLARLNEDPDLLNSRRTAIRLPRMSFEMVSVTYDPTRKIASTQKMRKSGKAETDSSRNFLYASVPYNIDFSLYIMTKYAEDATQLMEQILPFFTPDWTVSARMVPDLDPIDIPIVLNSVTTEDLYEGDFQERQSILYTLSFTLKGYFFGPEKLKKVIKFIDVDMHTDTAANTSPQEKVIIQPGMDALGNPISLRGETAEGTAVISNGQVQSVTITDDGQAYNANNVPSVTIAAPSTTNATANAEITSTSISALNIETGGGYYTNVPNVLISEPDIPSANAEGTAVISSDAIDSITITNPGTFYNSANVSISEPPAKSAYIKYGDDALYHGDATDATGIHTMTTNLVTAGQGFAIEFWIYPEAFPTTGVHNIVHFDNSTMRIEIEPDREIVYRPAYNGPPVRSTPELLTQDAWNHVRMEHVGGNARWLVNGTVDAGENAPSGFLIGGGTDVIVGQRNTTESFRGAIDNFIIDQITTQTAVGSYTIPSTPQTGSDLTANFEKQPASANVQITDGVVTGVTIIEGGANYANTTPTITFTTPNGTTADFRATATATLTDGVVTALNITDGGKFYTSANVSIDPAAAVTATGTAVVDSHGDISSITITNPGAGYSTVPSVTIGAPSTTSVPYQQIEFDDDWGIITIFEDA